MTEVPDAVKDRILQRSNEIGELAYCKLIGLAEGILSVTPELSDSELLRMIRVAEVYSRKEGSVVAVRYVTPGVGEEF